MRRWVRVRVRVGVGVGVRVGVRVTEGAEDDGDRLRERAQDVVRVPGQV